MGCQGSCVAYHGRNQVDPRPVGGVAALDLIVRSVIFRFAAERAYDAFVADDHLVDRAGLAEVQRQPVRAIADGGVPLG